MPRANVLLLVTGGIAAYKASYLTRLLVQTGFSVRVAMTDSARRFVTPLTFQALSSHPVATDLWGEGGSDIMDHIEWARWADLAVVAPATANLLAKAAHGIADDMVTTLLLAAECPLVLAPAMNDAMWRHPATQDNMSTLRQRGAVVCEPGEGDLACGTVGTGRMSEPETILAVVQQTADLSGTPGSYSATGTASTAAPEDSPWSGRRVVITAGPTWEPVDPVRYLANRSTGVFGYALAAEAVRLGADVVLISGPTSLTPPAGLSGFISIETAAHLADAVKTALDAGADWLFMAAAVADFRAAHVEDGKVKKESLGTSWNLEMTRTVDILGDVVASSPDDDLQVVGFALETDDLITRATDKMRAKGMDFIIANDLSAPDSAFGDGAHCVHLIGTEGTIWTDARGTKDELAAGLFEQLAPWAAGDGDDSEAES
ncbi:MAG: bifunctional phosphopantothenoylcysteine decarboxylase/phosphopantothenate synthase [bacterium]